MGFLTDWITDWLKELLINGILGNLGGLFDNVNTQVGEIAADVGMTPGAFNPGVFSLIRTLSETVVLPIAGLLLTFVMTWELIQLIIDQNNLHQLDTWIFFKWVFKTMIAVLILTNTFNIVMGIFDVSQHVINNAAGIISGSTDVNPGMMAALEDTRNAPSNHSVKTNSTDEINVFSGIIRCADCGAAMAFNRKVRKNGDEKQFYRCSRYANNGRDTCTTHTIDVEVLESVILHDIQHHAKKAIRDEKRLMDRLLVYSGETSKNENAAKEKSLRDAECRISFVEDAGKKLFEERVLGNVPESLFKKMLVDYEHEIMELSGKVVELRRQIQDSRNNRADIQNWLNVLKECATIDSLDRATAYQLIDHVDVHEQCDDCGISTQTLQIKYNFVGCIS